LPSRKQKNNNNNDRELIARFQSGDIRAVDLLLSKYYKTIYQTFIFKGVPEVDASDFTQVLCMRLFRVLQNFEPKISFKSYLQRAIQNMFLDYLRRKLNQDVNRTSLYLNIYHTENKYDKILLDVTANQITPEPDDDIFEKELREIVCSCIAAIEHPIRRVLVCLWLDGYKRKTMAELLQIPFGTVNSTLEAGKKLLRMCVKEHYLN
jgi:RNA polymerase sigma factor (sigma-70 family)